ncbi:MAG: ATP-dependent DNA helicase [Thermoplasmata archaeon]
MLTDWQAYFPYRSREVQDSLIELIAASCSAGKHLVLESGTGTGKTVSALSGVLAARRPEDKVIYLVRTNTQQQQVMTEIRRINEVLGQRGYPLVKGVALQGRSNLCPFLAHLRHLNPDPEELSVVCQKLKKSTQEEFLKSSVLAEEPAGCSIDDNNNSVIKNPGHGGCRYYLNLLKTTAGISKTHSTLKAELERWLLEFSPNAVEAGQKLASLNICPYEYLKRQCSDADIVCVPYIFFMAPYIRNRLFEWMNTVLSGVHLIIDEAHNIPNYAREMETREISVFTLESALKEGRDYNITELLPGLSLEAFIRALQALIKKAAGEFLIGEDGLVPPSYALDTLMLLTGLNSLKINSALNSMIQAGMSIIELLKEKETLPRSYLRASGAFFKFFLNVEDEKFIRLVVMGRSSFDEEEKKEEDKEKSSDLYLQAYCLDPADVCSVFNDAKSTVHMSGTLAPLEEYARSVGLDPDRLIMKVFPSPFDPARRPVYFHPALTSKYEVWAFDRNMQERIFSSITRLINSTPSSAGVYFSSFSQLESYLDYLRSDPESASGRPETVLNPYGKTSLKQYENTLSKGIGGDCSYIEARVKNNECKESEECEEGGESEGRRNVTIESKPDTEMSAGFVSALELHSTINQAFRTPQSRGEREKSDVHEGDESIKETCRSEVAKGSATEAKAKSVAVNTPVQFDTMPECEVFPALKKKFFIERQSLPLRRLSEIVETFRLSINKDSVLLSVIGGRLSEGLDFSGDQMRLLIVVAIPYPKPCARQRALEYYYDVKFRRGWEMAVEAPTTRKLMQTIGRLIRSEDDYGAVVVLDNRIRRFEKYIPVLIETQSPEELAVKFLNGM